MDIKDIAKALSTEFRPNDPEHFRLGVWYDGDTLENSSIKISKDLDSGDAFIDILDKKGTGMGTISDIRKHKETFNAVRKHLPPGDYGLRADHPTKAKKYIHDYLKEPGFNLSGEKGAAKVLNKKTGKLEHKSFDTLTMTVPKRKPGSRTTGNPKTQKRLADLLVETDDFKKAKELRINKADDLEVRETKKKPEWKGTGPEGSKPSGPGWDDYNKTERAYWKKHGKGSGKFYTHNDQKWRLDQKNKNTGALSPKNTTAKAVENARVNKARAPGLKISTLDPLQEQVGGKTRKGYVHRHHANAAKLTEKGLARYEKNLNPNWKISDGLSPDGKKFLKNLQNREGIPSGDMLANFRDYPRNVKSGKSPLHTQAHAMMSKAGIDPRTTSFEGMTNSEIYSFFKNKVGPTLKEIDETLGIKPQFTTRQAGKFARDALRINNNPLVRAIKPVAKLNTLGKMAFGGLDAIAATEGTSGALDKSKTFVDRTADILNAISGISGLASFTPAAPVAAPISLATGVASSTLRTPVPKNFKVNPGGKGMSYTSNPERMPYRGLSSSINN